MPRATHSIQADTATQPQTQTAGPPYVSPVPKEAAEYTRDAGGSNIGNVEEQQGLQAKPCAYSAVQCSAAMTE